MNPSGWNPAQLVARGVFDSLEEADAVLCRWDEARAHSTITPESWRRGMAFDVPISRRLVASGEVSPGSLSFPAVARGSAGTVVPAGPVICPWCAMECAMNGQGAAPRTGFVSVARCERHSAESPELLGSTTPKPPGVDCALSRISVGLSR